jgi:steroid delta-isomerase-like uncharacterized protein
MSLDQNKDVTHRFIDEWLNRQNQQSLEELTTPDYALYYPGQPGSLDRSQAPSLLTQFHAAFPDFFIRIDGMVAEGDWVAVMCTATGTNSGPYMGMQPTGKAIGVSIATFYRLRDGKIVEDRPVIDTMGMWQQLGVAPQMAAAEPALVP